MNRGIILIGAGGHAKVIYETVRLLDVQCLGYVDDKAQEFYGLNKINESELDDYKDQVSLILSFGAVTVESLIRRKKVFLEYLNKGFVFTSIISPRTYISDTAQIADGVLIVASSTINADSQISSNAIINTGAIIEHDVVIGHSSHICPGAIILGGARIGEGCLIGAGAVVLPNAVVPDGYLVPANTRFQVNR